MRWLGILAAIAACDAPAAPVPAPSEPRAAHELPAFGRGQAVAYEREVAFADAAPALRLPTVWQVPDVRDARAVVYGTVAAGETHAIEEIEIDTGRVVWRDAVSCGGPVVGVTAKTAVCADGKGVHAVALGTGKLEWETEMPFLAMDGDRVAIAASAGGSIALRTADSGDELGRVALPAGVAATSVVASCGVHEVFAANPDGKLARLVDGKVAWTAATAQLETVDACAGDSIVVTERGGHVVAIARATGKTTGEVLDVRGMWPARDGAPDAIEIATGEATLRYARDLAGAPTGTNLGAFGDAGGELIASRGVAVRLVRVTARTAALVDAAGIRAIVPFGELGGALGDRAVVAASWQGTASETVHRRALPAAGAARPSDPVMLARHAPMEIAAELRDLPAVEAESDGAVVVASRAPEVDAHAVAEVALDPSDPRIAYVVATAREPSDLDANPGSTIARADLAAKTWTWQRTDACGPGTPAAIAFTRDAVVCAARSPRAATLRATDRATGKARWELTPELAMRIADSRVDSSARMVETRGDATVAGKGLDSSTAAAGRGDSRVGSPSAGAAGTVGAVGAAAADPAIDGVLGGGDVVVAIAGDRGVVLDAATGRALGAIASDDGMAPRVAIVGRGPETWLAVVERGAIALRVPRAEMMVLATIPARGTVRALAAVDDAHLLAELEDGDAYVVDVVTGEAIAVPSPNATTTIADHEWITTAAPGGPLYGPRPATAPAPVVAPRPLPRPGPPPPPVDTMVVPPTLPTPLPPPPRAGTAWQFAMFAPGGGLVARNDFALVDAPGLAFAPLAPAARAPRAPFAVRTWREATDAASVVLVLAPATGDPVRRIATRQTGAVFSTIVDGKPVLGMAVAGPLRIVAF